jgi:HEAT repeat protein
MSLKADLDAIFTAERQLRRAETSLLAGKPSDIEAVLTEAVAAARGEKDRAESELRLMRLADLCAQVPGPAMADALLHILDDENPAVRVQAAEALVDVAYDRYAEVARSVERALDSGKASTALRELPWVIAEVAEPSALSLLRRFLTHADAEVAASAVEALASLGDTDAIPALEKLKGDPRMVTIDDGEEEVQATLGELAREAIDTLGS